MREFLPHLIAIFALSLLCMGWVFIQFLAKRAKTKNHFEHKPRCGHCAEADGCLQVCEKEEQKQKPKQ